MRAASGFAAPAFVEPPPAPSFVASSAGGGGTLHPDSTRSELCGELDSGAGSFAAGGGLDGGGGGTTAFTLVGDSDRIGAPNAVFGIGMLGFVGRVTGPGGRGDAAGALGGGAPAVLGVIGGLGSVIAGRGDGVIERFKPPSGGRSGLSEEGGGGGIGGDPNVGDGGVRATAAVSTRGAGGICGSILGGGRTGGGAPAAGRGVGHAPGIGGTGGRATPGDGSGSMCGPAAGRSLPIPAPGTTVSFCEIGASLGGAGMYDSTDWIELGGSESRPGPGSTDSRGGALVRSTVSRHAMRAELGRSLGSPLARSSSSRRAASMRTALIEIISPDGVDDPEGAGVKANFPVSHAITMRNASIGATFCDPIEVSAMLPA